MIQNATVLFDLDGTLVDTLPDLWRALSTTLESASLPCPPSKENLRTIVGLGAKSLMVHGLAQSQLNIEQERIDELTEIFFRHYRSCIVDTPESVPFPGVISCLSHLSGLGARLGVCTNKSEELSCILLKSLNLDHYFEIVAGWDTYPVHKPHPDHLILPMNALGGTPERTVMVGDSQVDVSAARAAGIKIVCVSFGYSPVPLVELNPDCIIDHFDALPAAITDLLADKSS